MSATSHPKSVNFVLAGEPKFFEYEGVTAPGVQTLISQVVPVGKKFNLTQAMVVCRRDTHIRISINDTLIGSMKTGPSEANVLFNWYPSKQVVSGETVKIESTAPIANVDIEAFLQLTEQNI